MHRACPGHLELARAYCSTASTASPPPSGLSSRGKPHPTCTRSPLSTFPYRLSEANNIIWYRSCTIASRATHSICTLLLVPAGLRVLSQTWRVPCTWWWSGDLLTDAYGRARARISSIDMGRLREGTDLVTQHSAWRVLSTWPSCGRLGARPRYVARGLPRCCCL